MALVNEQPIVVWWCSSFFQQVLQQPKPGAARPSPQLAWYAQLRSNAAALPPFIMRHAILPDPRMRSPMKHSTSKSANRSPDDFLALGVRLACRPPLGALLGAVRTARP